MFTVEIQLYIRLILLLTRAGCGVLRKIVVNGLQKQGISLEDFLSLNKTKITQDKRLYNAQLKLLYPHSSDPPDILKFDISLLCYLILEFFTSSTSPEYDAVKRIREIRNTFQAHYSDASIDVNTYSKLWSELTIIISTLSSSFTATDRTEINDLIRSAADANLNMRTVMEEIKTYNPSDDFSEKIQKQLEQIAETVHNYHQDVMKLHQEISEIRKQMESSGQSTTIVNTVFGQLRLTALEEKVVVEATKWLLQATKASIKREPMPSQSSNLQEKVDQYVEDIENIGVIITDVREGSVLFTFECPTLNVLLDLIDYFHGSQVQMRLDEMGNAIGDMLGQPVTLTSDLLLQPLQDIVAKMYNQTKILNVGLTCTGIEGLQHALDAFEGGAASHSLNDVSKVLSNDTGKCVVVEGAIDIESMQKAINSTKQQLEKELRSAVRPKEKEKSIEPYYVTLPVKVTTEPYIRLEKEVADKVFKHVENDLRMWNQQKCSSDVLKCVHIDNIKFESKKKGIRMCFALQSDVDLEQFNVIAKKPQSEQYQNVISEQLTKFMEDQKTVLRCEFPDTTELVLKVVLPESMYYKGKTHFSKCEEEEEEESTTDSDSMPGNKYNTCVDETEAGETSDIMTYPLPDESDNISQKTEISSENETNIRLEKKHEDMAADSCSITMKETEIKYSKVSEEVPSEMPALGTDNLQSSDSMSSTDIENKVTDTEKFATKDKPLAVLEEATGNTNEMIESKQCIAKKDIDDITGSDSVQPLDIQTKNIELRVEENKPNENLDNAISNITYVLPNERQGTKQYGQQVKHNFLVSLRPGMSVSMVSLHIEGSQTDYSMRPHSEAIYEVSAFLPVDIAPGTRYHYEDLLIQQGRWPLWNEKLTKSQSRMFEIGRSVVHRDFLSENSIKEAINFHFNDILFCQTCHKKYSEAELCEQIEDVGHLKSQTNITIKTDFIKKMIQGNLSNKSLFLVAVFLSVLCVPGKEPLVPMTVDRELAQRILIALSERHIETLPLELSFVMCYICRLLTQQAYGDDWCPLMYLQACYPFYTDKLVFDIVKQRERIPLAPEKLDTRAVCKSLCEKLAERSYDQNPENICRRTLVLILENVPIETAIYVYNALRLTEGTLTEDEKYFQDVLRDTARKLVRKSIDTFTKKQELGNLIDFAKVVCKQNPGKEPEFCEDFEIAILEVVQFAEPKVGKDIGDDMKSLFFETECFKMPHQQEKLLMRVVESANEHIFRLFIELTEVEEFVDTYSKLRKQTYENWFQPYKTSRRHKVFDTVFSILNNFSQLYRIAEITQRDDVSSDLKNLAITQMKNITLKDLLKNVVHVEKLCDSNQVVGALFEHQVLESVKSERLRMYDILHLMRSSAVDLSIEYKFTLNLIVTLMEQMLARQENQTEPEYFIFLTGHIKSLKLITNARGKFKDLLLQNKTYQEINQCIKNTRQKIESEEVSRQFVKLIDNPESKENVRKLMQIQGGAVEKINLSLQKYFDAVEETAKCILNVLSILKRRKDHLPGITLLQDKTLSIQRRVQEGDIFAVDCRPENEANLWGMLKPLPQLCKSLENIIKSDVFWNLTKETVDRCFEEYISSAEDCDIEKDIKYLFEKDIQEEEELNFVYLRLLQEKGIKLYQTGWIDLEKDSTLPMKNVFSMFKSADVIKEIELAADILRRPIESSVKGTLEKLRTRNEVLQCVQTMKLVLKVFCPALIGDGTFQQAVELFENLKSEENMLTCKFVYVQDILETVFEQARVLTQQSRLIMSELGNASHLIKFLRTIANDDIRTLIDAVEHISEQHVRESTVSALIEVKRFVYPFLDRQYIAEKGSRWLFQTINKQVEDLGDDARTMASKIDDCKNNIHNLKSLIGNAANRGEQTKEVITRIVKKGNIYFRLDGKQKNVCFEAKYRHSNEKTTKSETTLIDLRSRALLLMNTERNTKKSSFNREEFKLFIDSVDLCTDIKELVSQLFSSGHVQYTRVKIINTISELKATKDKLLKDSENWVKDLQTERKQFYLLNFINGRQIPILNHYLKYGEEEDTVLTILKFIHPDMTTNCLRSEYRSGLTGNRKMLESIGKSLNLAHQGLEPFRREIKKNDSEYNQQITDIVHEGQVRVVNLERNSSLVIKTVLTLYKSTSQNFPEPHQMLFCTRETRWSEIDLLLERCAGASEFYKYLPLFCIANVELLRREIQDLLVQAVDRITGRPVLLAIVCQGSENLFRSKLSEQIETVRPLSDEEVSKLLQRHCPKICTYTSDVAGLGKTTSICSYAITSGYSHKTLHISGTFKKGKAIEQLRNLKLHEFNFLHLDIGNVQNPNELDIFLFELIILKYVSEDGLSFCLVIENISIEISNTINDTLINALHFATSFNRVHLNLKDFSSFLPSEEITSATQVVCSYLDRLEKGDLDKKEIHFTGQHKIKPLESDRCRTLMEKYIHLTGETSFNNIHIFLNVLSEQLKKLSVSEFFRNAHIMDMIGKDSIPCIRSTLVNAMITVALEFSSRSVQAIRSVQSTTSQSEINNAAGKEDSLAEKSVQRVECMIRWEDSNHLIFVFHNQNIQTLTPMYRDKSRVEEHVQKLFERQMNRSLINFSDMDQEELQGMLQKIARKNITPLTHEYLYNLAKDYALTPDNLLKMVLIMMRVQAKVPVILMGETGCGKTSLIRYLSRICEVPFSIMNIHAGITFEAIVEQIEKENDSCCKQLTVEKWLFLDEINTSKHIGVISDAICHHRCSGKLLAPNLVIMGACNPYKLRSDEAARTAGLEGKIRSDELSRLVYRVLPLPETMIDYVWDFGSLSEKDEEKYIQKMIEDVFEKKADKHLLLKLLAVSQSFVRDTENATFSVSLRDVYRCKTLVKWFAKTLPEKQNYMASSISQKEIEMRSIILALAHCFHSRFSKKVDRRSYRQVLESVFISLGYHRYKEDVILSVIKEEQQDILRRMDLPSGIARNTALQENVFMLLVCILNKIPIFLVGKPGCSKSLAMQVIRSNIRGKDSKDDFFKNLPQLYCVSFQGSESSTSDGISMVFEKAEQYQKSYARDDVLSVVILDEIGLAEISGFNPLKVLHNLLEPDGQSQPNVAVVGISNWALDASKMNRAIHLSRPDMDLDELIETGVFISESFTKDIKPKRGLSDEADTTLSTDDIKEDLKYVAKSYSSYTKTLKFKNFHGLRDYYFLVKFITRTLAEKNCKLADVDRANVIMKGLQRNFGGLPKEGPILLHHFKDCFRGKELDQLSTYDLVVSNIKDSTARHLMLITKGESVLAIVEDILRDANREKREIIFGSHFEDDLTDDYNYRILSKIIMCMEQGIVLILKDLEKIYGSLYDMLNQNYTRIGAKNNCRVALGPYSNPFCHVAESFRCIVLVDEQKLDYTDPPFLNRFEKQFLTYSSVINEEQKQCLKEVEKWLVEFSTIDGKSFTKEDMFPIYNEEMMVSLVIFNSKSSHPRQDVVSACKKELLWLLRPEAVVRLSNVVSSNLKCQKEEIKEEYFALPLHGGINELVKYQMRDLEKTKELNNMTILFTNSNIHTNIKNFVSDWTAQFEKLQTFKSEKQLSSSIEQFWKNEKCEILFLQCSAVEDERHIMLTKTIIERYGIEIKGQKEARTKKLVFLAIHLDGSDISTNTVSQINYLSGWKLIMMDTLEKPAMSLRHLCSTDMLSIIEEKRPLRECLEKEIFWAFTKIRYGSYGRDHVSISKILEKMKNDSDFLSMVEERICSDIQCNFKGEENMNWQMKVACDVNALNTSTNFVEALECFILNAIKHPLAKIIFKLESLGAVNSYFMGGNGQKRLWKYIFQNERLFSISEIQNEFGPWCYSCERADLSLVMPFSRVIFENIEATREDFLDEIPRLRAKCDIDANEVLPDDVTNELVHQQQNYMFKKIPDLQEYEYENMKEDYVKDFCNLVSYTICASLKSETRIHLIKCAITQNIDFSHDYSEVFARLHCMFWANASLFGSFMLLLESCVEVFEEKEVLQIFEETVDKKGFEKKSDSPTIGSSLEQEISSESKWVEKCIPVEHAEKDIEADTFNQSGMFVLGNESMLKDETFHQFISLICSKVLPAPACLKKFGNAQRWQLKARNVMTVAAEVSRVPKKLHALRFCDDVATHFLFPHNEPVSKLETIGALLVHKELDSETVFQEILSQMVSTRKGEKVEIQNKKQKIFSQYLIRCITSDPDTTAYTYFFKQVQDGCITDKSIGLFKAPIRFLLHLENTVNKEALYDLVKPKEHDWVEWNESLFSESAFFSKLDVCLKETIQQKANCSFNVLIIDLLQELYSQREIDDYSGLLLQCGTVLQTGSGGLKFIAALSLLKVIIAKIGKMVSEHKILNQTALLTVLNATYTGIIQKDISKTLMIYFLKIIANSCPLNTVMKYHESLTEKCASLSEINWTKGYIQVCFDRNPLSLFVADFKTFEFLFSTEGDESTMRRNVSKLVEISRNGYKGLLFLFSLTMREIYLTKFFDTIQDSKQRKVGMLLEYLGKSEHSRYTKQLLICLTGKESFKLEPFLHAVKTPAKQYFMLTVLISSYSLVLANEEFKNKDHCNVFATCLMQPAQLKSLFIPGFPHTPAQAGMQFIFCGRQVQSKFSSCTNCSLRLAFHSDSNEHKCPVCKNRLETAPQFVRTPTKNPPFQMRGFFCFKNFVNEHFRVRNLSPVTCNVLYIFVKGFILGSFALGFSSLKDISKNQHDLKTMTEMQLWEEIAIHWTNIAKLLNFDDHCVAVFLHAIMHRAEALILGQEIGQNRLTWEQKFDNIVTDMVRERFSIIIKHIQKCDDLYGFSKQTVELQIREADDITLLSTKQQNELLPEIFRVSEKPSKSDFIFQLQPEQERYPFLVLVLSHEHNLDLPQYIHNIIQWHLVTVVHTCFSLKSYECSKMSVQDFLDKIPGENNRDLAKKRFEAFKTTWGLLTKVSDKYLRFKNLPSINTQSSLNSCLILEEKSIVFEVLSHLVRIQNDFIDRALSLCFVCDNLYFLSRGIGNQGVSIIKNLPITETRREHLLNMSFSWIETLMHESYSDLSYGQGRIVHYEFGSVEKELIAEMLVGKAYLNLSDLPEIVFTDQLYRKYASLVEEVCVSVKQEPLPSSTACAIRKNNEENKCMAKDLINYLDMVMTLLQKMKCDSQKPLVDFAAERSNILGRPLPRNCLPNPDISIKLCHVVSLHELLEELCADPLIEGLDEKYCALIDDQDMRDHFENMPKVSMKTAETVVRAMKRFVYRCMSMREAVDAEQPLIRYLSHKSFWPDDSFKENGLCVEDRRQSIDTVIPTNVFVCHVQSIVVLLMERIEKITQGEEKIDKVIDDWKTTQIKKEEDSRLIKRRKMMQFKKT